MNISGRLLVILLATAAMSPAFSATEPASLQACDSCFPNDLTALVYRNALASNDQAVVNAALYNEAHVLCYDLDSSLVHAAVGHLQKVGDDYSLTWLDTMVARPALTNHHALFKRTRDAIAKRLEHNPQRPEQLLQDRLIRAAVADITCNRLELTLSKFTREWILRNSSSPQFKAELERIAKHEFPEGNATFYKLVKRRAISKARANNQKTVLSIPQERLLKEILDAGDRQFHITAFSICLRVIRHMG
jgi:hypothetical protein